MSSFSRSDGPRMPARHPGVVIWSAVVALLTTLGGPGRLWAQASAMGTVRAGVVSGLTVLVDQGLDFGLVIMNSGPHTIDVTSPLAAHIRIDAEKGRNVTTTVTPNPLGVLQRQGGTETMAITLQAAYNETVDDPASATAFPGAAPWSATIRPGLNLPGNNRREAFIYLGGTIQTNGVTVGGLYLATVTVAVAY